MKTMRHATKYQVSQKEESMSLSCSNIGEKSTLTSALEKSNALGNVGMGATTTEHVREITNCTSPHTRQDPKCFT